MDKFLILLKEVNMLKKKKKKEEQIKPFKDKRLKTQHNASK